MQFKVGDRVKFTRKVHDGDSIYTPFYGGRHGKILGTVIKDYTGKFKFRYKDNNPRTKLKIHWDNGNENGYPISYLKDFKKVSEQLRLF